MINTKDLHFFIVFHSSNLSGTPEYRLESSNSINVLSFDNSLAFASRNQCSQSPGLIVAWYCRSNWKFQIQTMLRLLTIVLISILIATCPVLWISCWISLNWWESWMYLLAIGGWFLGLLLQGWRGFLVVSYTSFLAILPLSKYKIIKLSWKGASVPNNVD